MKRSGVADLPLHGGRVPAWLASRMSTLGTAIAESVMVHYGRPALLSRLSDPFWFQALGSVMGMDWHSSGITTSVLGALKRGLNPRAHELGIYICGGRGKQSLRTPQELRDIAGRVGIDGEFHRGQSAYDRYYGDPTITPNPNLRPLDEGPYYAVKMVLSDLGTCGGLRADERARVLREDGTAIDGLYAIGNTAANVFGASYPGAGATIAQGLVYGVIAATDAAGR